MGKTIGIGMSRRLLVWATRFLLSSSRRSAMVIDFLVAVGAGQETMQTKSESGRSPSMWRKVVAPSTFARTAGGTAEHRSATTADAHLAGTSHMALLLPLFGSPLEAA
ncbi:hypothetical protein BOTBODRAFT_179129 [Botryobasidium botryosum FD-172 SS1]|uniref:Secreted protein n=1 Tax=Botryobasidium botryosum (strain FD-172 SS1) TaxID=930990 RepID=A0A067M0K8_BOTB1|nr:hypothetical protein BOTBODRAFT_179129 [Botryobasidium botryosum FD-172 SS1]